MKHYLYTCYCGPQITRLDADKPHNGYIYENCPALSAPVLNHTWDDLTDYRVPRIVKNLKNIETIFRKYGCKKAALMGSFVQNQTKSSSDIDFAADISVDNRDIAAVISMELTELLGNVCDVSPYFFLKSFPHDVSHKCHIDIYDDTSDNE